MINKAQKDDRLAFEKLMSIHLEVIYHFICAHVSIVEDVKDILQETMLAIWQGIKMFNKESSFRTWALGIARRKIADYYRDLYKSKSMPISDVEDSLYLENEFDKISDRIDLNNAISILTKDEKELIYLAFTAQLSYSEISRLLKIPIGTVKSKMSTIKAKLKKQLEKG